MDKNRDKIEVNKSVSVHPGQIINEVIQTIESVDKKIEKFYEIHGTKSHVTPDSRYDLRRGK